MYMKVPKKSKILKEVKKNYHIKNEKMVDQMMKTWSKGKCEILLQPRRVDIF